MQPNPFEGRSTPSAGNPDVGDDAALGASVVLGDQLHSTGPASPPLLPTPSNPHELMAIPCPAEFRHPQVWVLGLNGGCGSTTLTRLLQDCGVQATETDRRMWPHGPAGGPFPRVLLVASSHATGLRTLEAAAGQWARTPAPVQLIGTVLIADGPGKNRQLRPRWEAAKGLTPRLWHIGWQEAWRSLTAEEEHPLDPRTRATLRSIRKTLERNPA